MGQRVGGKKSAQHVVEWVKACVIFHNMLLECDGWHGTDVGKAISDAESLATEAATKNTVATAHRERITKEVLKLIFE